MNKLDLSILARKCLSSQLDLPGSILYGGHETLRRGDIYLMGFNPGGTGGDTLGVNIDAMFEKSGNAYLDESWGDGSRIWPVGEAPLQKRVRWVLETLGVDPRSVCATNLIFVKSRDAKGVEYKIAGTCWPVHEAMLGIVKPKLIVAFGNSKVSPYEYLWSRFGSGAQDSIPSGHGNWTVRGFKANLPDGSSPYVVGLPHLSRYKPDGKPEVATWLQRQLISEV